MRKSRFTEEQIIGMIKNRDLSIATEIRYYLANLLDILHNILACKFIFMTGTIKGGI